MKPDDIFVNRFDLLELSEYVFAFKAFPKLVAEKENVFESFYDECGPTITSPNYDEGTICVRGANVEDKAIQIIERKDEYNRMIERYEQKAQLFEQAMETLTLRERDVIHTKYFDHDNNLKLSPSYFNELLTGAENKLCSSICEVQLSTMKESKIKQRQDVIRRVNEFKRAN